MQNNFSKCREWVPRGTSQHKWRWLTTLLLILTLGIGQMWGDTTLLSEDFSNCNGTGGTTGTYNVSYSGLTQITSENKSTYLSADIASVDYSNSYVANGCMLNKGSSKVVTLKTVSSTSFTDGKATLSVRVAGWSGSSSASQLKVKTDNATITEVGGSQSKTNSDLTSGTAPAKGEWTTYTFNITNVTANLTITIKTNYVFIDDIILTTAASGPSVSGFSPVSGSEVESTQEISISGSTGSTVYYLWATEAPANAAAVVSADHHGTSGAASATTTVESGKTLYAVAVKDATNSAVASASYTIVAPAQTYDITYTETKGAVNTNPSTYTEGVGIASFAKLRHVVGYDFTGWSPTSIAADATGAKTVEAQWTANAVAEGTGTLTYALAFGSGSITTTSITRDNGALYDATDVSVAHTSFDDNAAKNGCSGKLATTSAKSNSNYVELTFKVADGYTFTPTEVRVRGNAVSTAKTLEVELKDNAETPNEKSVSGALAAGSTDGGVEVALDFDATGEVAMEGTVTAKIFVYGATNAWRLGTSIVITGTVASTTPPTGYPITKSATNGSITTSVSSVAITSAEENAQVDIVATPETGYQFSSWNIYETATPANTISPAAATASTSFTMPAAAVTVGATFSAIDYTVSYTTPSNGSYTIQVGEAAAVSANTTANNGETITLAATPESGYRLKAWDVYKTGESTTKVSVSNNTFTMPAYDVTVSATFEAIPTVADLVTIADDYTFTPSAAIAASTLAEDNKFIALEDGCTYGSNGLLVKENRPLAFKVNNGAKVKVTFTTNGDREMQLGTAASDDDNKAYGHSKTSPVVFDVTADGVVYLTASSDLRFSKMEIVYPHSVAYALNGGEGTLPTESAHYVGDEFTLHNGVTDITAPAGKEFAGWNDGTTTYDGGAEYTMGASAVTLTAQWVNEVTKYAVTYDLGDYTEGVAPTETPKAENAVFALKTAPARPGYAFKGWKCNIDEVTYNAGVDYTMTAAPTTFTAQWKAVILLIEYAGENYSINTDKFTVYEGTELQNEEYTVDGKNFAKNFKFANTCSSTPFAGQAWSNKFMAYDVASNSTDIKLYVYNKNNSNKKLYYQIVPEGSAAAAFQSVTITSKATNQVVSIPTITAAKGARVLFGIESTDVRICQIEVTEDGTALPAFGTNGYEFSVPGRAATYNKVGAFDGFEFKTNADLKFISGQDYIALRNIDGSQYVKFTVATNIQLQVTTPNANKFYVSKTAAGDAEKDTKYGGSAAVHNVNLHAGTYYIAPAAGGSDGEVRITKLAFATAPAVKIVTFNVNGGSSVEAQEVFAGDKAVKPEDPTKDGYRFVEWQLSGSAYDFDDAVATDITLDAVWQKTWNVTFNADNGSDAVVVPVDDGQPVAQPANPEKSGFDFVEWQWSGSAYDFATLVTDNITLTATWEVAQDDATLSALSYNGNAIDVNSAVEVAGVKTYTVHLQWGSTINDALISVTKNAESASLSAITYDGENKKATFSVESGNHLVVVNYAIQFVIDAKRGTSIIKATTNNVVTGLIGGARDTNLGDGNTKKLNKGNYFGVTLANDETFQEGDVFIVNITAPADLGKFMIYADAERTELIADQGIVYTKPDVAEPVICPTGEMMMTLPAAATGKKSLYISRENAENTQQWNVTFSYIEVTREMNPAIKSFKFGENAATINEAAKTITYEVAYGTAVTALTPTVEAYGNNGATYTPAGATDFTSPVVYTVTDAYNEFHTDYTVTVNIAAPSTNAYLASLSVAGYALDFDKEEETYNIVLDYGTTVLPEITYAVEDAGLAEAVKVEDGVNGATTITVTPQAGESYKKVYTINFSVSTTPKFVIYDGQKSAPMAAIATSGSDVPTGFAWTITGASNTDASNGELSFEGKTYSKYVNLFTSATKAPDAGNTRYITITIPDGYVAKFRLVGCGNGNGTRSSFISKEITGTLDQSIAYATTTANNVLDGRTSDFQLPGTYYYCADNSIRLYELSVTLYPIDVERTMTQGRFGTICYPYEGRLLGAMLLEIAYFDPDQKKIFFDEVVDGQMVAGAPYLFLPNEGVEKFAIKYTDNVYAPAGHHNGLYGSYTQEALPTDGNHYIMLNNQYCKVVEANTYVGANRAYIKLDKIGNDYVAPAYGRRRVSMDVQGEQVATGMEGLNVGDQPIKLMINGQMYILRGDKMYDATGRLVK